MLTARILNSMNSWPGKFRIEQTAHSLAIGPWLNQTGLHSPRLRANLPLA
jgi:hypothetical protein